MDYKQSKFEIKASGENTIEGYAAFFGNVDSYGDIIEQGAFTKTLKENRNRIKVLWQHDTNEPIGKPIAMEEDSKGLYIKAQISMTDAGRKAMTLMKDGVIDEMSIGYDVIKDDYKKGNRMLKEVRLWEFSPVTFAANEKAKITSAKNFSDLLYNITSDSVSASDIKSAIAKLDELLKRMEPDKSTQDDQSEEEKQLQAILQMVKQFQNV